METLPRQEPAQSHIKHYISKETWILIEEKFHHWSDANDADRQAMTNKVRKASRKDKPEHHLKIINSDMSCKQIWQSITRLRSDFVPKMYARKDQQGQTVALDKRAEATAEYLSQVRWGKPAHAVYAPDEQRYLQWINSGLMNTRPGNFNTDPITIDELNQVIKEIMRGKASGPDDISFDFSTRRNVTSRNTHNAQRLVA